VGAFLVHHGPQGRLLPVLLEPTEVPPLLAAIQQIDARDRDAARVAREIALLAGRPAELQEGTSAGWWWGRIWSSTWPGRKPKTCG